MPSQFHQAFADASHELQEQFAERDDSGQVDRAAVVIEVEGQSPVECSAIVGKQDTSTLPGFDASEEQTIRVQADIPVSEAKGIEGVPLDAKVTYGGKTWRVSPEGSSRSSTFLTLALDRPADVVSEIKL